MMTIPIFRLPKSFILSARTNSSGLVVDVAVWVLVGARRVAVRVEVRVAVGVVVGLGWMVLVTVILLISLVMVGLGVVLPAKTMRFCPM